MDANTILASRHLRSNADKALSTPEHDIGPPKFGVP